MRAPTIIRSGLQAFFGPRLPAIVPVQPSLATDGELLHWRGAMEPVISIVVPVYNQIATTLECLRSVVGSGCRFAEFELVIVDDASTDPQAERLRALPGITYHRNRENVGFVGSCNVGARLARGRYLVFLNSDTLVTPGWLEQLISRLEEPGVGLVGACLRYPDGRLQEAGGMVFDDASAWNYGRNGHPDDPRYCTRRDSHYCSGAALALARERFLELGGFDPRYAPGYYEDTDLAMRVRAEGERVVYEPRSIVVHLEGASAGTDTSAGMKAAQVVNRERFQQQWQETLAQYHPDAGTDVDLVVRGEGAAWLVACAGVEPQVGFLETLEVLAEHGCVVDLVLCAGLPVERIRCLRAKGVFVWPSDWHATVRWLLIRHGRRAHGILLDGNPASLDWLSQIRTDLPSARAMLLGQEGAPVPQGVTPVSGADAILQALDVAVSRRTVSPPAPR